MTGDANTHYSGFQANYDHHYESIILVYIHTHSSGVQVTYVHECAFHCNYVNERDLPARVASFPR
jgi:hypothetical protein